MILIIKTKCIKKYQVPEMPNLENKRAKVAWLRRQKMLASIYNIKSVSVQVKDIKYMLYSKNSRLASLYAKFCLNNNSFYDDNDYITITKSNSLNKSLMYALISTDWLLNINDVEKKSIAELQQECMDLQNKIYELEERKKRMMNLCDVDFKIKLLEYKLSCLSEILNKVNTESDLNKITIGRVLLKDKK